MKILEVQPMDAEKPCDVCQIEQGEGGWADHYVHLELFPEFDFWIWLCKSHLDKLKQNLQVAK